LDLPFLKRREFFILLNEHKRILFSLLSTCESTCKCRVSAVGVKLVLFQSFEKYNFAFFMYFNIIQTNAYELCVRNLDSLCFMISIFVFETWKNDIEKIKRRDYKYFTFRQPYGFVKWCEKTSEFDKTFNNH